MTLAHTSALRPSTDRWSRRNTELNPKLQAKLNTDYAHFSIEALHGKMVQKKRTKTYEAFAAAARYAEVSKRDL
jgi:superfamily II DNA/RNA helicase